MARQSNRLQERQHVATLQLAADYYLANGINSMERQSQRRLEWGCVRLSGTRPASGRGVTVSIYLAGFHRTVSAPCIICGPSFFSHGRSPLTSLSQGRAVPDVFKSAAALARSALICSRREIFPSGDSEVRSGAGRAVSACAAAETLSKSTRSMFFTSEPPSWVSLLSLSARRERVMA